MYLSYDKIKDETQRAAWQATDDLNCHFAEAILGFTPGDGAGLSHLLKRYAEPADAYLSVIKTKRIKQESLTRLSQLLRAEAEAMEAIKIPEAYGAILRDVQDRIDDQIGNDQRAQKLICAWKSIAPHFHDAKTGGLFPPMEVFSRYFKREAVPAERGDNVFLNASGRDFLHENGVGYTEVLYFMNLMARATQNAWVGHSKSEASYPSVTFLELPADSPLQNTYTVFQGNTTNELCCHVHRRAAIMAFLPSIISTARHESEHALQCSVTEWGMKKQDSKLTQAPILLHQYLMIKRMIPRGVIAAFGDEEMNAYDYRSYMAVPYERMAYMAGDYAEQRFCEQQGLALKPKLRERLARNPSYVAMLSERERANLG